jgi:hypothetical protein
MNRIRANAGQDNMRPMTDFSGERYWTLVAEFEAPGMAEFEKMMQGDGMSEAATKEFERLMEGYHDLIDTRHGRSTGWRPTLRRDRSRTWCDGSVADLRRRSSGDPSSPARDPSRHLFS